MNMLMTTIAFVRREEVQKTIDSNQRNGWEEVETTEQSDGIIMVKFKKMGNPHKEDSIEFKFK